MKLLLDTNILFSGFLTFLKFRKYSHYKLFDYRKRNEYIISTYILNELKDVLERKEIVCEDNDIVAFLNILEIKIFESDYSGRETFAQYVNDIDDIQIIKDTADNACNILCTKNIKDFKIQDIKAKLHIDVISYKEFVDMCE